MLIPLVAAAALGAAPLPEPDPGEVYHGRREQLDVAVPRLDDDISVDGRLDEAAWAEAAVLTGFSQFRPQDGLPAADSTEVLVWYADTEIHFGIRAFEPHVRANATLADRDRIGGDDYVLILLDTFDDRRRALVFGVNPLGIQMDGVWTEGHDLDLSPDFVYESRGRVTEYGYEVELRIPFESIRYQPQRVQSWGINVLRRVQHSGHDQTWTPVRIQQTSFLAQSGTLRGLTDLRRGLVLDVNPVVTSRTEGAYDDARRWGYAGGEPEFGANLRWGVSANLTLNATVQPDFSQVESDAGQVVFDPRRALFFAEKRPFFLEASENFLVNNSLIYTRRIVSPVAAAKFTGNAAGTNIGVLSAVDDDAFSWTGRDNPIFNIVRLRRDLGASSNAGIVYTDRIDGSYYNRVAAADARLVFGEAYSVDLQAGASFTHAPWGDADARPVFLVNALRRSRTWNIGLTATGSHPEFEAHAGFIGRPGIVHTALRPTYTVYGEPGARIESWTGSVLLDGTWRYHRFVDARSADDQKLHVGSTFVLRGGWRIGTTAILETFKYPPELYQGYWIDLGTDTVPYTGTPRITNYGFFTNIMTPQLRHFSGNLFAFFGRDENFEEWAPAWIGLATLNLAWRPSDQLRVSASWVHQRYHRYDDKSLVAARHIPRLKLEYQLSRPIFFRLVGQYDAQQRDDLRDNSRTDRPILICDDAPPNCTRATAFRRGSFRADWLFSYQPSPGTVLFAGYGNTLASDDGLGLGDLRRAQDGFFVKLSYLWRL